MKYLISIIAILSISACTPTVKVETPSEPITINLNIDINHKVKVEIDQALDELISAEDDLF